MKAFIYGLGITSFLLLIIVGNMADKSRHELLVYKEVGTMLLEGQNEMEIVMNVKSTTDLKEVQAALAYYKEATK